MRYRPTTQEIGAAILTLFLGLIAVLVASQLSGCVQSSVATSGTPRVQSWDDRQADEKIHSEGTGFRYRLPKESPASGRSARKV